MQLRLDIDPDIRRAQALPPTVYHHAAWLEHLRDRVFARTWHGFAGCAPQLLPGQVQPWTLLAGSIDEPLLLTTDDAGSRVVSNVCTHRGAILVDRQGRADALRCPYHGRCFSLAGRCTARAPSDDQPPHETNEVRATGRDDLPTVPWASWRGHPFASLDPVHPFDRWTAPLAGRLDALPWSSREPAPELDRDYHVHTSWLQYCEHALDPGFGRDAAAPPALVEPSPWGVRTTHAAPMDDSAPSLAIDGRAAAMVSVWLFPTTVVDIHPWGTRMRLVLPLGPQRTRVVVVGHTWDGHDADAQRAASLDEHEHAGQRQLTAAARGMRARLATRGRYDPIRDRGMHHFHRLLATLIE